MTSHTQYLGFLDGVSHELRTPLSSILAFADVSLREGVGMSAQQRAAWTEVAASASRLSDTLDNVLDVMYLDSGKAALSVELVDLVDVVCEVDACMRPRADERAIELVSFVAPGVPFVEADPDKLRRALENLVDNALKFTPRGGLVVVHAFHRKNDSAVHLRIDDNGIGIAEEDQAAVFERYAQVDDSVARSFGGCGLGLAVAREFVAMHGGTVRVDSTLGAGSSFTIALPTSAPSERGIV